jgi:hypothetical protein
MINVMNVIDIHYEKMYEAVASEVARCMKYNYPEWDIIENIVNIIEDFRTW